MSECSAALLHVGKSLGIDKRGIGNAGDEDIGWKYLPCGWDGDFARPPGPVDEQTLSWLVGDSHA